MMSCYSFPLSRLCQFLHLPTLFSYESLGYQISVDVCIVVFKGKVSWPKQVLIFTSVKNKRRACVMRGNLRWQTISTINIEVLAGKFAKSLIPPWKCTSWMSTAYRRQATWARHSYTSPSWAVSLILSSSVFTCLFLLSSSMQNCQWLEAYSWTVLQLLFFHSLSH